jgi:hypothetical protein
MEQIDMQKISKSIQWWAHPDENLRLLRYFQFNMKFDENIDYTPKFSNTVKVGFVINIVENTDITAIKNFCEEFSECQILIHDNYSKFLEQLRQLSAENLNIKLITPEQQLFEQKLIGSIAEINCIFQGLIWSKEQGFDILFKLDSDKLINKISINNLKTCCLESDAITYINSENSNGLIPFNTKQIAFYVNSWSKNYPIQCLKFTIDNELPIHNGIWFHEMTKTLSGNNFSKVWKQYCENKKINYLKSGYAECIF